MFKIQRKRFQIHLAAETKYLSSLHVEMNKASSTEPTGFTLLQEIVQTPPIPAKNFTGGGQTLSTNYSVGLNGMAYG